MSAPGLLAGELRLVTTDEYHRMIDSGVFDEDERIELLEGVIVRMALEVLVFRSLFKNTKMEMHEGPKVTYHFEKWLWLAGLAFHYSFLIIVIRHLRFFVEPVPFFVTMTEKLDAFLQVGLPGIYITDGLFLAAVTYLFIRRIVIPQVRYISLAADYFPLGWDVSFGVEEGELFALVGANG